MTEKDIRPIPRYLLRKIGREDKKQFPAPDNQLRFYAYLTIWHKELVKVTVAVRHYRRKRYCKAVAWHGVHSGKCLVKDLEYNYYGGMGFRVGWYEEGIQKEPRWYERGVGCAESRYYDPWAPIVNPEVVGKLPEYKYSAYSLYHGPHLLKYLQLYERYPQLEMLMKAGLGLYYDRIAILKKIGADKAFRKWLLRRREELSASPSGFYVQTILKAYQTNRPLQEIQNFLTRKKSFDRDPDYKPVKKLFRGQQLQEFFRYLDKQKISPRLYLDYLRACEHLQLDMSLPQNRLPHDFMRWHDIRTDQYATAKAEADKKEKRELYEKFAAVAKKYLTLQYDKRGAFLCVIARSPADLIREGEVLHHCVGRMNYDRRFIREESLIFFIRSKERPEMPLVTLEYSLTARKVLQCYGEYDRKPDDDVLHYVHKIWLPYANRALKKLSA